MTYYIIIAFVLGAAASFAQIYFRKKRLWKLSSTADEVKKEIGLVLRRLEQKKNGAPKKPDITFCSREYGFVELSHPYLSKGKYEFPGVHNIALGRLNNIAPRQSSLDIRETAINEGFIDADSKSGSYSLKPC